MTLYIQSVATKDRCIVHEQWKGRIDQWQPRRRQQRKRRSTRSWLQTGKWGTPKASPKVFVRDPNQLLAARCLGGALCKGFSVAGQRLRYEQKRQWYPGVGS